MRSPSIKMVLLLAIGSLLVVGLWAPRSQSSTAPVNAGIRRALLTLQDAEPRVAPLNAPKAAQADDAADANNDAAALPSFEVVHLYIDSGRHPLAAYQLDLSILQGNVRFVGIEGGDHEAFRDPPYYDPRAMTNERAILAAFNTAPAEKLPKGRVRIATVSVMVTGKQRPRFEANLLVAAGPEGGRIDCDLAMEHVPPANDPENKPQD